MTVRCMQAIEPALRGGPAKRVRTMQGKEAGVQSDAQKPRHRKNGSPRVDGGIYPELPHWRGREGAGARGEGKQGPSQERQAARPYSL